MFLVTSRSWPPESMHLQNSKRLTKQLNHVQARLEKLQEKLASVSHDVSGIVGNTGSLVWTYDRDVVENRIQNAQQNRSASKIKECFEQFSRGYNGRFNCLRPCSTSECSISEFAYLSAAKSLKPHFSAAELESKFAQRAVHGNLNLHAFECAIQSPSKLEQWAQNIPFWQLLVDSIEHDVSVDPLRSISRLTVQEIDLLSISIVKSMKQMILDHVEGLAKSLHAMDEKCRFVSSTASKFQTIKGNCGSIDDFHAGLSARLGTFSLCI
jgi:hypothetical protein